VKALPVLVAAALLLVAACAGPSEPATTTPTRAGGVDSVGLELFEERVVGANPGCVTCHSLEEGVTLVGPSLFAVESPIDGLTTAEYVRQSILDPDAYVVAGFVAGQMQPVWGDYLSPEQVESLVVLLSGQAP
jgi:mono/diheme cytochrome c family protein